MSNDYPPAAFSFTVSISGESPGCAFQEVAGLDSRPDTEEVVEGGENRFAHRLPPAARHSNLVLKHGIASSDSPLVTWVKKTLVGDIAQRVETRTLTVTLSDAGGAAQRIWTFDDAWPVKWKVGQFDAVKNAVAIESIELAYRSMRRTD